MKTKISPYVLNTLLILGILMNSACSQKQEPDQPASQEAENNTQVSLTEAQFNLANIELGKIEMRTISALIQASGQLDVPPQSKISISAPMGGIVKETELLQGSHVKKGQPVAVMQHNDYIQLQQDYKEMFGQIEYLKAEYERQEELAKENVNAKKTLQKAKAEYLSTKARLDGLRAKLQLLNINVSALETGAIQNSITLYSPIEGYVTKVNVNIGSFVDPNNVLFEIVNTEHLHAELTVFEKDVHALKTGQKVLFTLANETKQRNATIYLIGKEISQDRTIQVHCHLDKEDKALIPGMYLKATVETDSSHVTTLPEEAVVGFEGKNYIFTERELKTSGKEKIYSFEMLEVAARETEAGFTHVVLPTTFDQNKNIVFKGAYSLLSKLKNNEE